MSAASLPRSFLDTNVLVYSDDGSNPVKQRQAIDLVKAHRRQKTGVVSLQVLEEYFHTVTRKLHMKADIARRKVEILANFYVVEPDLADVLAAIDMHRLHQLSIWDTLIVRAAQQSGCSVLLTEDLQHGQKIDGVRIVNPFL